MPCGYHHLHQIPMMPLSPNVAVPVNQAFFYLNPFCFWLGYHTAVFKIQISYAACHCKSTIHMRLSHTVPGNEATALPNPVQRHKRKNKYELLLHTIDSCLCVSFLSLATDAEWGTEDLSWDTEGWLLLFEKLYRRDVAWWAES